MITRGPATAADLRELFGYAPGSTVRALAVREDGALRAVVGIALERDHARFFADFKEDFRPQLKRVPVMRAVKAALEFVKAYRGPVLAVAQPEEADAERLLMRLGFEHYDTQDVGEIYAWPSSHS